VGFEIRLFKEIIFSYFRVYKGTPVVAQITQIKNITADPYAYCCKYKAETGNNHLVFLE
jgi:hypothetical protein